MAPSKVKGVVIKFCGSPDTKKLARFLQQHTRIKGAVLFDDNLLIVKGSKLVGFSTGIATVAMKLGVHPGTITFACIYHEAPVSILAGHIAAGHGLKYLYGSCTIRYIDSLREAGIVANFGRK